MIALPDMADEELQGWKELIDAKPIMPHRWTLIGGQMVHLLCAEHGAIPPRSTRDLDVLINVRAYPHFFRRFIEKLEKNGFEPELPSAEGVQHRWKKGNVQIDVTQPRHLGERLSQSVKGDRRPTAAIPGAQQAIDRSELKEIRLPDGTSGWVSCPDVVGALVIKGAAWTEDTTNEKYRHLTDFATLATLIKGRNELEGISKQDRIYLKAGVNGCRKYPAHQAGIRGAEESLVLLGMALDASKGSPTLVTPIGAKKHGPTLPSKASYATPRCGQWMPRAKRRCSKPVGHSGAHS